jgi:hypothetical protein
MKSRWLIPLGVLLIVTTLTQGQPPYLGEPIPRPLSPPVGHLVPLSPLSDSKAITYDPRPGDIVLYDDFSRLYHLALKMANTAPPTHAAMVIARPDGTPALLELTGPTMMFAKVVIMDVETRFRAYPGTVMVRRVRTPLSSQQCQDMTQFAEMQTGKSFALGRVLLQATPFCPRTGLRREWFGRTYPSRNRWFCSEMVVAAGAAAHVLDGKAHCANATYPRDLAYDETLDLSSLYHPPMLWNAAQAR